MKSLSRSGAMSVRLRRRNDFLAFFIVKYGVRCAHCGAAIDKDEFRKWRDGVLIRHHDNDATNNAPENIDIMHRSCHHKVVARERKERRECEQKS